VDKLMENGLWPFPTSFSTLIHTLTTLRQEAKVMSKNAGGAINKSIKFDEL
jgi:hypothetical protein